MTSWVHRGNYPSTALQFIGDICLNLLITAGAIALAFGVFLLA